MVSSTQYFRKTTIFLLKSSVKDHQESFPAAACRAISRGSCTPFIKNSVMSLQTMIHDSNGDKQTYHPAQKNPIGQPINNNNKIHKIVQRTFIILPLWFLFNNWGLEKANKKLQYHVNATIIVYNKNLARVFENLKIILQQKIL